jgi:hypothetical protein
MLLKFGGDRAKEVEIGTTSGDLASGLFRTIQHLLSGMRQSLLPSQPSDWQKFLSYMYSTALFCHAYEITSIQTGRVQTSVQPSLIPIAHSCSLCSALDFRWVPNRASRLFFIRGCRRRSRHSPPP